MGVGRGLSGHVVSRLKSIGGVLIEVSRHSLYLSLMPRGLLEGGKGGDATWPVGRMKF